MNELVTNAIKHGGGDVSVVLQETKGNMCISIATARGQLPEGFSLEDTRGFGLRAVRSMVNLLWGRKIRSGLIYLMRVELQRKKLKSQFSK